MAVGIWGELTSQAQPEATGFLARLFQEISETFEGPTKDWILTVQRKQCGTTNLAEAVNGTIRLGEAMMPIPAGTKMKITLQPG